MSPPTTLQPKETKSLDIYGSPPLEWQRVIDALDRVGDRDYADPGSRFWLATTRPDGRPHLMAARVGRSSTRCETSGTSPTRARWIRTASTSNT